MLVVPTAGILLLVSLAFLILLFAAPAEHRVLVFLNKSPHHGILKSGDDVAKKQKSESDDQNLHVVEIMSRALVKKWQTNAKEPTIEP